MSIVAEITRLQGAKSSLKTSIEGKGVTVPSETKIDGYAALVDQIQAGGDTDGLNGFLSVESKTIPTSASQTTNITYNKNCGILDENYKKWDTLAWHQRWVDNGYSATGLSKPIGIWMKAFGLDLVYLWQIILDAGYTDVSGTATITYDSFSLGIYNANLINHATSADITVWPANQSGMIAHGTAGKYKSATWRAVNNGDGLDMVCDNTLETFTIPSRDVGTSLALTKLNYEDYMESYYQECEFYRALFAICSGIATTQPNGTKTTVEILNSSGQQAAVNEDMYFYIGGTNTGLLAKYNLNCLPKPNANVTSGNLGQTTTEAIYAKQIAAGINMNDTGVNSTNKPILVDGAKGAEAVAVDGYWYIKTPYIGNPSSTQFSASRNIPDSLIVYYCKHNNVSIPTDRTLYPYFLNSRTHVTSLVSILRTVEGLSDIVPTLLTTANLWTSVRYSTGYLWQIIMQNGTINGTTQNYTNKIIPCVRSTQQYTT